MPFCPKCRVEFQDWAKVCSDCGVDLVDKLLPIARPRDAEDVVTIATFPGPEVAHVASAKLEIEGIWSFVADENVPMYMGGPVRLLVMRRDANKAVRILGLSG